MFEVWVTRLVAVLVIAISLCACEGYHFAPSPSPTNPGVGYDVIVTEQDQTATVRVGQALLLELHSKSGMTDWHDVKSANTAVLTPLTIDVMVPRGVTLAAFKGASQGEATVTDIAGGLCPTGVLCPTYAVLYSLRVTVVPG